MYLKSIEMQGFKSFANKMVLDFHNGITGIVGPNGSGKSNVADAVRWVLGEQSAKQLRGESMQDVIFSGTENRRPLSYAYVSITLDNSDHMLPVDYNEVTVSRRVYRSGESEYLLNGVPCRLRDVHELFYDTGIGKEGYSIIGQGQIEKILSGKPEERRELFDEAVGIVKFKKRKEASEKRLMNERENLTRVNDILSELEGRVEPLRRQSETAKRYLSLKDNLKKLDVNLYLVDVERIQNEVDSVRKNAATVEKDLNDNKETLDGIKSRYFALEQEISELSLRIESLRDEEVESRENKSRLENQISILEEQIKSAATSDENLALRKDELLKEKNRRIEEKENAEKELNDAKLAHEEAAQSLKRAIDDYQKLEDEIRECNQIIENDHQRIADILRERTEISNEFQKYKTTREQTNIRKAEIVKQLLSKKTEDSSIDSAFDSAKKEFDEVTKNHADLTSKALTFTKKSIEWKEKRIACSKELEEKTVEFHRIDSQLEALRNIQERYEGFGNTTRRVMEQKDTHPGVIGVVSDLMHVERKYETAIETALGGNIQNIVTEDEATAKEMIRFLKQNKAGRATFLPLTSVKTKDNQVKPEHLREPGVLGIASELVDTDEKYREVMRYLLGRVIVMDTVDHALAFAKRTHYANHVVTLEGEYLRPGGSLSGGAFKNNNNLLGRNRQMDQMQKKKEELEQAVKDCKIRLEDIDTAVDLMRDDQEENRKALEEMSLRLNTAKIRLEQAESDRDKAKKNYESLNRESADIEKALYDIEESQKAAKARIDESNDAEKALKKEIEEKQEELDQKTYMETSASRLVSESQIDEANASQKVQFLQENLDRILGEIEKTDDSFHHLDEESRNSHDDVEKKQKDIEEIKKTIEAAEAHLVDLKKDRDTSNQKKEGLNEEYHNFFAKREEVTDTINRLDKELFRLNGKSQRLEEELETQNNYMWDEYELTLHAAMELRDEELDNRAEMKKEQSSIKDEIRKMGTVNVNAIEEYKEVSERYEFLKTQHDDLIKAEQSLMQIIQELDEGMRKQFACGFKDIQTEFDKAFKALFGGGHGTLELVEGEDILETGIRIIAQPPGKKLQNMMQLSGGEKSLTAIALLFAIQNLKPSPFCLLDEIEAALDDSNVDRFARYLHRLTKNTQFIVITHRRGTMNSADRLYGITMQEKGVSTLVSVNLIENQLSN